ncbi:MAG: hypothetical protein KAT28_02730 [Candidatus Aenigmarchaeota archaeon]|nr:hypothetical protein [Candidatus Aenigmarchaeota archaeon]
MKGQWYIVAAVLFSFSLLSVFNIFESYSEIDFTSVLKNDEDKISSNIIWELKQIEKNSTNAVNLEADVSEFLEMTEANLIGKGYYFEYNFSTSSPSALDYNLTISGRNMVVKYRP